MQETVSFSLTKAYSSDKSDGKDNVKGMFPVKRLLERELKQAKGITYKSQCLFNCLNGWITSVAIQVTDGRRQSLWNCPWDMIVTEVPAHFSWRKRERVLWKVKRNMKKTKSFAYISWIDEKSAKVSLKPPPTFMPGILLQPTTIITLVRTWLKLTLKQTIVRVKRESEYTFLWC